MLPAPAPPAVARPDSAKHQRGSSPTQNGSFPHRNWPRTECFAPFNAIRTPFRIKIAQQPAILCLPDLERVVHPALQPTGVSCKVHSSHHEAKTGTSHCPNHKTVEIRAVFRCAKRNVVRGFDTARGRRPRCRAYTRFGRTTSDRTVAARRRKRRVAVGRNGLTSKCGSCCVGIGPPITPDRADSEIPPPVPGPAPDRPVPAPRRSPIPAGNP